MEAIDEFTHRRDQQRIAATDDATLVFMLLGLNAEAVDSPTWGCTPKARYLRRLVFLEIAQRWIPDQVMAEAVGMFLEEDEWQDEA